MRANWIVLAPDSTVPALTNEERTLAVAGVAAHWAYPAADTLAGMRYSARSFLVGDNAISRSPGGIGAFAGGTIERK